MADRDVGFQSLTPAVRQGAIPWSVAGFARARAVVQRARSGQLKLPPAAAGLPADLLEETALEELALGLWLRREHRSDSPEVPAAHHLRFHAIEQFLARYGDLLMEENLVVAGESKGGPGVEPAPLLVAELVNRPYDTPLEEDEPPGFDPVEVLKAVARRARESDG